MPDDAAVSDRHSVVSTVPLLGIGILELLLDCGVLFLEASDFHLEVLLLLLVELKILAFWLINAFHEVDCLQHDVLLLQIQLLALVLYAGNQAGLRLALLLVGHELLADELAITGVLIV